MNQRDIDRLELQLLHHLSHDNVAYCMMGMDFDPKDCELGDVMCAVRKLLRKGIQEEVDHPYGVL